MASSSVIKHRSKRFLGAVVVAFMAVFALVLSSGTAFAAQSNDQIVDKDGDTVQAILSDMTITPVPPLDGNPLTRQWRMSGKAGYHVTGPKAGDWNGHIKIGYMVGYTASFDGKLHFDWSTPNLSFNLGGTEMGPSIDNLLPSAGVSMEVGFGPGITDVDAANADISGAEGVANIANFNGTVNGVVGPTHVQPYVTVTSSHGDSVTTYGQVFNL